MLNDIIKFLFECTMFSYAADGVTKKLVPAKHVDACQYPEHFCINHSIGNWRYNDEYREHGEDQFSGVEMVWKGQQLVFKRTYMGGMYVRFFDTYNRQYVSDTFAFLRKGMRKNPGTSLMRGPMSFQEEHWQYNHTSYENDMATETVKHYGIPVHVVNFHIEVCMPVPEE
jgi:hypothetical protein